MATTLQELRKEAGYRTAKDFAEAIDVPPTTYARYEQSPEKIPLKQAWMIADFLGCSIDVIVGREHIDVSEMHGDIQRFYDSLSEDSRTLFDEFKEFLEQREEKIAKEKKRKLDQKMMRTARYYERLLYQIAETDEYYGPKVMLGTPDEVREAFEEFITKRAKEKRAVDIFEACEEVEDDMRSGSGYWIGDSKEIYDYITEDQPEYEEGIKQAVREERRRQTQKLEARDKKTIAQIMEAYDALHDGGDGVLYSIVNL